MQTYPILVFRTPTIQDTFGGARFAMLALLAGLGFLLLLALLIGLGGQGSGLGLGLLAAGLVILGGAAVAAVVWRRGQVELRERELVDTRFGRAPWALRYEQIEEVKRGAHNDEIWIHYHPLDEGGRVNPGIIRRRALTPVVDSERLREELARRAV